MNDQGYLSPAPGSAGGNIQNQGVVQPMGGGAQGSNMGVPQGTYVPEVREKRGIGKIIAIVILSLMLVTFIGLFIWMFIKWDEVNTDVQGQINEAVAIAELKKSEEKEEEFREREKDPRTTFAGPEDYGSLSFSYPKTWSVYEAKDASSGGDYEAYFNPDKVLTVGDKTINALRAIIRDKAFDQVVNTYDSFVKNGKLSQNAITVNGVGGVVYEGEFASGLRGKAVIFKLRDKTVILQTDADIFKKDFDDLIQSVMFVQ